MIIHMKRRGFTIIELIIVVTIMGILLTIGVVNLRGSQANGRDAERKVDADTIALHLETYYTSGVDTTTTPFSATGGTITTSGGYTIHTFITSGTFTPNMTGSVEVLVVAGGGGGATDIDVGGGGGGGGFLTGSLSLSAQSYSVTVGAGGARGTGSDNTGVGGGTNGTRGGNSIFSSMTAIGGGYGGTRSQPGGSGGSGGGGGDSSQPGGLGTSGQGYNGGTGPGMNTQSGNDSGGGGGAGGAASYNTPGVGLFSSIGNATFAKGGRGAQLISPADGAANTGDGGTGARAGGSGIVIIRYLTPGAGNTHTATYPSTALTATTASMIQYLRDIDTKSITAPGITDPTLTFISATCTGVCVQTTAGVTPQPTKDQYIYQPIHSDGSLCNDAAECRKFNLYYKLENATTDCPAPNNICMITSRNQ